MSDLAEWNNFYVIVGSAAGALMGAVSQVIPRSLLVAALI